MIVNTIGTNSSRTHSRLVLGINPEIRDGVGKGLGESFPLGHLMNEFKMGVTRWVYSNQQALMVTTANLSHVTPQWFWGFKEDPMGYIVGVGLAHRLSTGVQDGKGITPAPPRWPKGNEMEDSTEAWYELESTERTRVMRLRPNTRPPSTRPTLEWIWGARASS